MSAAVPVRTALAGLLAMARKASSRAAPVPVLLANVGAPAGPVYTAPTRLSPR